MSAEEVAEQLSIGLLQAGKELPNGDMLERHHIDTALEALYNKERGN